MASKIKVDQLETADGSGTIALQNQLSGMTNASMPTGSIVSYKIATINPSGAISTSSTTFVEADSGLRIAHAMANSGNKLIFNLHTIDNYIQSGKSAWFAVTSLADVTTNLESKSIMYVKSGNGVEPFSVFGMQEHSPSSTSLVNYCVSFKNGGTGTAYLNNTPSTGQVKFSLMEIKQ